MDREALARINQLLEEAEKDYLPKAIVLSILDKVEAACKNSVQPVFGHEAIQVLRWQLNNQSTSQAV